MKRYLRIKANISDGAIATEKTHVGETQSKVSTASSSDAAFVFATRIIDILLEWSSQSVPLFDRLRRSLAPCRVFFAAYKIHFYLLACVRIENKQIKAQSKQNAFLIDSIG